MDEIKAELDLVYKMISTIPVVGDHVDTVAAARSKLRKIYADITKLELDETPKNHVESPTEEM